MLTAEDLPRERFRQTTSFQRDRQIETQQLIDAYFSALAMPASIWVGMCRQAHRDMRRHLLGGRR